MGMPGRKPKDAVDRYPCGKVIQPSRRETREQIIAVVVSQPHRAAQHNADSKLLGSSIGRLYRAGLIDGRLFNIADRFHKLVERHKRVIGCPSENAIALDYGAVKSEGRFIGEPETDEEKIKREAETRRAYSDMHCALEDAGRDMFGLSRQGAYLTALRDCIVQDKEPRDPEIIKQGLNVLASLWRDAESGQ